MDELKDIQKEIEAHPLQHRLISERQAFDSHKPDNHIRKAVNQIIAYEKAIKRMKHDIKHTTKTGREKAAFITRMRASIKYKVTLIKIELEALCTT